MKQSLMYAYALYICVYIQYIFLLNRPSEQTKTKQRFSLLVSFKLDCISLPQYCSLFPRVQMYCFQASVKHACRLWLKSFAYRSQTFLTGLIRLKTITLLQLFLHKILGCQVTEHRITSCGPSGQARPPLLGWTLLDQWLTFTGNWKK